MKTHILTASMMVAMLSANVNAATYEYGFSILSNHASRDPNLNNSLYINAFRINGITIGTYHNSYFQRSFYITNRLTDVEFGSGDKMYGMSSIDYGFVSGYSGTEVPSYKNITPLVSVSTGIEAPVNDNFGIGLKLGYVPSYGGGVLNLMLCLTYDD